MTILPRFCFVILLISVALVTPARSDDRPRTTPRTLCSAWLRGDTSSPVFSAVCPFKSPCPRYSTDDVDRINFVINKVLLQADRTPSDVPPVFPGPPVLGDSATKARRITDGAGSVVGGHVGFYPVDGDSYMGTWSTPLQLPDNWVYHYAIHRVAPADRALVRAQLETIQRTRFYKRFKGTENAKLPFLITSDWFAQYARVYEPGTEEERKSLLLSDWAPHVTEGNIRRLWVEAAVRVDDAWLPTAQPERSVVPIAVETTSDLFLVSEEVRPQRAHGGNIDRFQGRIVDINGCNDLSRCFAKIIGVLSSSLNDELSKPPLGATRTRKILAPHQLRYERLMQPSIPLQGLSGPYYELSTYTLVFWRATAESFVGTAEGYFANADHREREDQIFMQVAQTLQIAVGKNGDYVEPTPQQYAAYQAAVTNAITKAVARTTAHFGGRVTDDVGIINSIER